MDEEDGLKFEGYFEGISQGDYNDKIGDTVTDKQPIIGYIYFPILPANVDENKVNQKHPKELSVDILGDVVNNHVDGGQLDTVRALNEGKEI